LQYIGDARIQALVTLYNTGDERIVKNALNLMDYSRLPEGLTESRHPSFSPQYIPTFSLWYIAMLHDYAYYGSDLDFVKKKLSGTRQILDYFKNYQQADGSLKNVPFWMFTDWVNNYDTKVWQAGIAPVGANGTSSAVDLQLLLAYQTAADLENKLGNSTLNYKKEIEQLKKMIKAKYWDASKQLFADRVEKDFFSQHTNILAIFTGIVTDKEAAKIAHKILNDSSLAPASIYFKYYLHLALTKAGLGNDYMQWLGKWRENMEMGLTTWAEVSEIDVARSDCHAWGASPNIEFYRIILGIDSDAVGFSKVKIEPRLGNMTNIGGEIPHPKEIVKVNYSISNGKLNASVELPQNITGIFVWKKKNYILKGGLNNLVVKI
jgi:alpha-L-rhamnosidase